MPWLPFLLFFSWVYIEISLFIAVADRLGVFISLLLLLFTSAIGFSLIRQQGLASLHDVQQKLDFGEDPSAEVNKSVALLLAGLLLFMPGFFTDLLGALLLLPPVRRCLKSKIIPVLRPYSSRRKPGKPETTGRTIEGEYQRKDED